VVYYTNRKVYIIVGESRLVGATTMGVTLKTINDLSTFVVTYTNVTGVGLERGSIVGTRITS
jgi:hypothetical protein